MPASDQNNVEAVTKGLANFEKIIHFIFSWVVLLPVSVIIAGKLLGKYMVLGFSTEDRFVVNVYFFVIRAKGDEVTLGLTIFIIALSFVIFFGGPEAYEIFKLRAGLDIGQWNSMCVIASAFSLAGSVLVSICLARFGPSPVVSTGEREKQLKKLRDKDEE